MNEQNTKITAGKGLFRISLILFLLFFINLLIGKGNILLDMKLPHLGSVAEFLLLGAASTTLIFGSLQREAAENEIAETDSKEI